MTQDGIGDRLKHATGLVYGREGERYWVEFITSDASENVIHMDAIQLEFLKVRAKRASVPITDQDQLYSLLSITYCVSLGLLVLVAMFI